MAKISKARTAGDGAAVGNHSCHAANGLIKNDTLTDLNQGAFNFHIPQAKQTFIGRSDVLNQPFKKAKARDQTIEMLTEDSAALLFADRHQGKYLFDHSAKSWFVFDGNVWRSDKTARVLECIRDLLRELSEQQTTRKCAVRKSSVARGVERFARGAPTLAVTSDAWDKDDYLLGTPGGTVDLRSGKLRPSQAPERITKSTAVTPAAVADCPLWDQFMYDATCGDEDLLIFLKRFLGYSLTGDTREQCLVFGHGLGCNGKGILLNTVVKIMHGYAAVSAMDVFTASRGDRHATDIAMLAGARLVTATETEAGRWWAESRIKALTGNDMITARFVCRDNFTFAPTFKILITGNFEPSLANVDDAARRRFSIVPFRHRPEKPDLHLEQKLRSEWPAILRWLIDGCLDWQANGLSRPKTVTEATDDYFASQDIVAQWLSDRCDLDPRNHRQTASSEELYVSWSEYARAAGEDPGSRKRLAGELKKRQVIPKKGSGARREFAGIKLLRAVG